MLGGEASPVDEAAPIGPSAEEEAALLSADRTSEAFYGQAPKAENLEPETEATPLPPMDDLVQRIPLPARELMEELFRARFVTVRRVPKSALKS